MFVPNFLQRRCTMRWDVKLILNAMLAEPNRVWTAKELKDKTGLDIRPSAIACIIGYHLEGKYITCVRVSNRLNKFKLKGK